MLQELRKALDFKNRGICVADIEEEVLLDEMSCLEAMKMWLALITVFGCKHLDRCLKWVKGRYYSSDFKEIFAYAMESEEFTYRDISEMFDELIESEEFLSIQSDPIFIIE